MFTSGSTGRPRGYAIPASGLESYIRFFRQSLSCRQGETVPRILLVSSISFVDHFQALFGGLGGGSVVCLAATESILNDPHAVIGRLGVTHVPATPSFLSCLKPEDCPSLQKLFSSGEPLSDRLYATWRGAVSLWNLYGQTETTCSIAVQDCATALGPASVGQCTPFGQIYILKQDLSRAPPGKVGEVCYSGIQLSKECTDDREVDRFVPNPYFSEHDGSSDILFRTGDLGRWASETELEIIGRIDRQVKVRG